MIDNCALVLEGGGMRGLYTTGILDSFLENHLYFEYVIGVSAGATHALSYISRQKGRARRVNVDYVKRSDYMGLLCLLREGSLFGMNLLFHKIPYEYDLYDFKEFSRNCSGYYAVVTNLLTGRPEYLAPRTPSEVLPAGQASCSLPLVSQPVLIGGIPYLDGGIADSIPVRKALADGNRKLVVVLTQPRGYRKPPSKKSKAIQFVYRKYPEFVRTLENRDRVYNETLDYLDQLEVEGKAFIISPKPQAGLKRLERNPERLSALHTSGYEDGGALLAKIQDFIA